MNKYKVLYAADSGIDYGSGDQETIEYSSLISSLESLKKMCDEGGELNLQIKELGELLRKFQGSWKSTKAIDIQGTVESINNHLNDVKNNFSELLTEVTRYTKGAAEIDSGTMRA